MNLKMSYSKPKMAKNNHFGISVNMITECLLPSNFLIGIKTASYCLLFLYFVYLPFFANAEA